MVRQARQPKFSDTLTLFLPIALALPQLKFYHDYAPGL